MAATRRRWLIPVVLLAVALLHACVLLWLSQQLQGFSLLRPMATPLFTRTIAPAAPVPVRSKPAAQRRPSVQPKTAAAAGPAQPEPNEPVAAAVETPTPAREASVPVPPVASTEPVVAQPVPDNWPPDSRASYVLGGNYRGPLHGDAQVQWQREGERYQVQLRISLGWLASMSMTSQGRVTSGHLEPELYEELTASKTRRHVRMGPTELLFMDGTSQLRPAGVQDAASQFVELTHRFSSAQQPLAVGQSVSYWLARPGGADEWTFDITEVQTLYLPRLGPVEAYHLKPRPLARPRGPITAEMWFAPSLQYLPVRIKISMDQDIWLDLLLDTVEQ